MISSARVHRMSLVLVVSVSLLPAEAGPTLASTPHVQAPSRMTAEGGVPAADQSEQRASEREDTDAKKRDKNAPVAVKGCLQGMMLNGVESDETIEGLTPSLRLLSKKDVRKQLKALNGSVVEATGVLKLPPKSPLSRKIGGTTVSVGVVDPRAPQNQQVQMQTEYGTLDVQSVESLSIRCSEDH